MRYDWSVLARARPTCSSRLCEGHRLGPCQVFACLARAGMGAVCAVYGPGRTLSIAEWR